MDWMQLQKCPQLICEEGIQPIVAPLSFRSLAAHPMSLSSGSVLR